MEARNGEALPHTSEGSGATAGPSVAAIVRPIEHQFGTCRVNIGSRYSNTRYDVDIELVHDQAFWKRMQRPRLCQKQIRIAALGLRRIVEHMEARVLTRSDHHQPVERLETLREPIG